jgi:signal transduction histidine kinase/ligand-binding sensor domain-containing protein
MSECPHRRFTIRCALASQAALKIIFGALLAVALVAQAQFRATHWSADDGLPQNIVRGIVQMPDGYLWIATLNGVARFDGVRFTIFDKSNTPGITTNRFAALARGIDGDLWLIGENGSVTRYHHGEFHTLGSSEGVLSNSVNALTSDEQGNVWIIDNGRIFRWNQSQGRFEPGADGGIYYNPLDWAGTGFWGIENDVLHCFVRGHASSYTLPRSVKPEQVAKVAVGADGAAWIDLPLGRFARFLDSRWEFASTPIMSYFKDPTRSTWKGTVGIHLERTLILPSESKGIRYNTITEDSEHNVWVGSEGQGLYRIDKQTIHVYSVAQGLAGANVYPVLKARNGDMWVGTWPAGVNGFHDGAITTYTTKDGLPGLVTSLAEDRAGNLWIGTHGGLAVLSNGRIRRPQNLPEKLPTVFAIFEMQDGNLLFGTSRGIYRYSPKDGSGSWFRPQGTADFGDVRVIVQGRSGDIWFGGFSGLSRLHNGVLTQWTERDGLPSDSVRAIYEDAQGVMWVGTYDGGLGRLSNGQWTHYNTRNGLFDNGVFQILEDNHANLWMSSNRGIFRASKSQLNDVAAGKDSMVISVSYGRSDGMSNVECNGGFWPSGAIDEEGKLWFPTQEGVAVVEPDFNKETNRTPKVVVESVTLDHVPVNPGKTITINREQEILEIDYTGLSFYRPEQVAFRYKMDGLDREWQDVGYRRTAYFSHLPPGSYTFRVRAATSDGIWSEAEGLPIVVLPPFYLTQWFILAVFLLLASVVYGIWSFRERQLQRSHAAQQAFSRELIVSQEVERRRISGELHDSLGQRLIIIKNHALFLLRPKADTLAAEERRQTIEEIKEEASLAIDETRAISYNLRPFQLDRLGISKAIDALVRSVSRATEIRFVTHIDDVDDSFPEDLRINFYRIVQESLNNIIKHSGATEAEIRVERANDRVMLSIRDNGKGLPADPKNVPPGKGGFGLRGIRERATVLGGVIRIRSQQGSGTLLTGEFLLTKHR